MERTEFLQSLEGLLAGIPPEERKEILYDYEEHFEAGAAAGHSDEAIIAKLGTPALLAKELLLDYSITAAENKRSFSNIMRAVWKVARINLINIFAVALPVGLGLLAAALLTVVAAALLLSPLLIIVALLQRGFELFLFNLFATMTLFSLGLLLAVGLRQFAGWGYGAIMRLVKTKAGIQGGTPL